MYARLSRNVIGRLIREVDYRWGAVHFTRALL